MSIRLGLLALLADGPRHGYQLRQEFEDRTGSTWPLNIGQVYTTLGRLERDGRIAITGDGDDSHKVYAITPDGERELRDWFATPVRRSERPRDELAIKLAMAAGVPGVDIHAVIQLQRTDTVRALQDYTRLKQRAGGETTDDLAWVMVLDGLLFAAEAELRWLDACEERLARHRPGRRGSRRTPDTATERAVRR